MNIAPPVLITPQAEINHGDTGEKSSATPCLRGEKLMIYTEEGDDRWFKRFEISKTPLFKGSDSPLLVEAPFGGNKGRGERSENKDSKLFRRDQPASRALRGEATTRKPQLEPRLKNGPRPR
jgi:hypothetical protein